MLAIVGARFGSDRISTKPKRHDTISMVNAPVSIIQQRVGWV
jgi:hypothetical protein